MNEEENNKQPLFDVEEEVVEVVEEIVDQFEDYTLDTTSERSSLLRRLPLVLGTTLLYFIIRGFDPNYVFNPVNANVFELIAFIILVFSLFSLMLLVRLDRTTFHMKETLTKVKRVNDILDFFSVVPVLMLLITLVNIFFVSFSPISGTSMEPNFHDDQAVIFSHLNPKYERFDVVIVYVESLNDPYLIKRIIGLPGETVLIDDNEIYIDGVLLVQDFIDQEQVNTYCVSGQYINYCSFTVPENSYFVLGDNRDGHAVDGVVSGYSIDSRTFGSVSVDDIYGKVIVTFKDYNLLD